MQSTKPAQKSSTLEHQVYLELLRLSSELTHQAGELLKSSGISGPQYNVLRILRGAGGNGLACGQIVERMISKDPDITRLLDRLEKQGLVVRARDDEDRRVVTTQITRLGLELLSKLDEPMMSLHRRQLGGLGKEKLAKLLDLLQAARDSA